MLSKFTNKKNKPLKSFDIEIKGLYRFSEGKHQKKLEELQQKLSCLLDDNDIEFIWKAKENQHWALLNGTSGMYYGYYNDGDLAESAVNNCRVHGFKTIDSFLRRVVKPLKAQNVEKYIEIKNDNDPKKMELFLENAMNEAILIAWEHYNNKK